MKRLTLSVLIATMSTWVAAYAPVASHHAVEHDGADHDPRFKPLADIAIDIDPESLSVTTSALRIDVAADPGISLDHVEFTTSGRIDIEESPVDVSSADAGAFTDASPEAEVEVAVVSLTGDATLTATAVGADADGSQISASDTIWLSTVDGVPVVSRTGPQDLALQVADAGLTFGTITATEAESVRTEAIGGTDAEPSLAASKIPCVDLCVEGTVQWTDRSGNTHAVRRAPVQIIDAGDDVLLATVTTDADGAFAATIVGTDRDGGERDIMARVLAQGPGFRFVREGFSPQPQYIESDVIGGVEPGSTVTIPFVANNVDDNNTVFSLHNAMVVGSEYLARVGSPTPPPVDIVFPAGGTYYDSGRVNILRLDRWDWDVMLHEYGHHVAEHLGIERSPGGPHSGGQHLADTPGRNKDQGVRLAWGEGWPTYFAVSALLEMDAASLGIPDVGDARYQDTEDTDVVFDLEIGRALGEDNEVTVAAVLWDLYDSIGDGRDAIALGDRAVWSLIQDAQPHTLSDAYAAFTSGGSATHNGVNCVLTQVNVSPRLSGPGVVGAAAPTFSWLPGNGGLRGANDAFVLEIRHRVDGTLVHRSGSLGATTYAVPQRDWNEVVQTTVGDLDVTVTGVEVNTPVTGPYRSCSHAMTRDQTGPLPIPDLTDVVTTVSPKRFVDTRSSGQTVDGRFAADGRRNADSVYEVDLAGRGEVPPDARAVVVNVTAIRPDAIGFVTGFDCSVPRPFASSLNYVTNTNTGNEIVLGLGADGAACLYTSAATDLTLDVTGYVAADSAYGTVVPARLLDTRESGQTTVDRQSQGGGPIAAGGGVVVQVAGRGGVPMGAVGAVVNVTAVRPGGTGFVTVHPCLGAVPNASSLNVVNDVNRGNELIAKLSTDGKLCLYSSTSTQMTVDVVGFIVADADVDMLVPTRLMDTRSTGVTIDSAAAGEGVRAAGSEYRLQVAGRHGVDADARSVVVNVTAVAPSGRGFITVHPCASERPLASALNYVAAVTASNEVIAQLDAGGAVCLYTSEATHLVVDVTAVVS